MSTANHHSQKLIVDNRLNWQLVNTRLKQFPAIARAFPEILMRKRQNMEPFYCHYMAWRLGTWHDDELFVRIEQLLLIAESLPNWRSESNLLEGGDFSDFWSLIWQLQVAEYLCTKGSDVRWNVSGPDLVVKIGGVNLYVECYVYRKAFGLECYLQDVVRTIGQDIRITRNTYLPLPLPCDSTLGDEISDLLSPLLDPVKIAAARDAAKYCHPQVLATSRSNSIALSIEGDDLSAYQPDILPRRSGNPTEYLGVAFKEASKAKHGKNALMQHRPNLVVVNFLLSSDVQGALIRQLDLSDSKPKILLADDIETLAYAVCGIDETLSQGDLMLIGELPPDHPSHFIAQPAT